jgi:hypothetical protein
MPNLAGKPWNTEGVRAALFYTGVWPIDGRPSVESLFGAEIEESTVRGPAKDLTQIGSLGAGKIHLNIGVGRCDMHWVPAPATPDEVPNLGDPVEVLRTFVSALNDKLSSGDMVFSRLALGAALAIPAEGKDEIYPLVSKMVPDFDFTSRPVDDFLLQVNYPEQVEDEFGAYQLNLLRKVSAREAQVASFQFMVAMGTLVPSPTATSYSAVLELDFNSRAADGLSFKHRRVSEFFSRCLDSIVQTLDGFPHA